MAISQQRRLFRCRRCGASILANAPPAHDDDKSEWPVCQGTVEVAGRTLDVHAKTRMRPPEVDDG